MTVNGQITAGAVVAGSYSTGTYSPGVGTTYMTKQCGIYRVPPLTAAGVILSLPQAITVPGVTFLVFNASSNVITFQTYDPNERFSNSLGYNYSISVSSGTGVQVTSIAVNTLASQTAWACVNI